MHAVTGISISCLCLVFMTPLVPLRLVLSSGQYGVLGMQHIVCSRGRELCCRKDFGQQLQTLHEQVREAREAFVAAETKLELANSHMAGHERVIAVT
jgi:hypothetical protein